MKNSPVNDVFTISREIETELSPKNQAQKIVNAYKRVEGYNVVEGKKVKAEDKPHQPQSNYAHKIKQTLKELNENKHKEMKKKKFEQIKQTNEETQKRLRNKACSKLVQILHSKYQTIVFSFFSKIEEEAQLYEIRKIQAINRWKVQRIFYAWMEEVILIKIESERKKKQDQEQFQMKEKQASEFYKFILLTKTMKGLKNHRKKQIRKREIEREEMRNKLAHNNEEKGEKQNKVLQKKLRGFLDNLKEGIENKGRLRTIKEKTEESDLRDFQQQIQKNQNLGEQEEVIEEEKNEEVPHVKQERRGPLKNEDLQKKRKELEQKSKNRKTALEALKKEKQTKKRKEEDERKKIQFEIEQEEKRKKQEKYERFIKEKREQKEWEEKEKVLLKRAEEFNILRLKNYYGFLQWKRLKEVKDFKGKKIFEVLQNVYLRRKFHKICENIEQIGKEKLRKSMQKAARRYQRNLLLKCVRGLLLEKDQCLEQKEKLTISHQFHLLKVFFVKWKEIMPELIVSNYEEEKPLLLKAQSYRIISLMDKSMRVLKQNKEEEKRERKIGQNKKKIEENIRKMIEQEETATINYDDYL